MTTLAKPRRYVTDLDGVEDSHKVKSLVEVLDSFGEIVTQLDVTGGTVSLDSTAEARGRFTLELPATDDVVPRSAGDLLAPFGNEVRISRGIERYDHIDLVHLGTFRIDAARVSGDTLVLEGLDRAGYYIDAAFESGGQIPTGTGIVDIIHLFTIGLKRVPYDFAESDSSDADLPFPISFDEGADRWAYCQGLGLAIGCELFFDRTGWLRLRPTPTETGAPTAIVNEGPSGVLLNVERAWDRGPAINRVIVTGTNPWNPDIIPRGVATDLNPLSPTYYYGRFGRKPFFYDNNFAWNNQMATDMAEGILARSKGAPDSISFGEIVDPTRSPSDLVRVIRDRLGLGAENHVIDTVDIPLNAEGEMTCRTRAVDLESVPPSSAPGPERA